MGEASLTRSPVHASLAGDRTLIEHWDGHQWSVIASPSPGLHSSLSAITLLSATDAWAVGSTWDDQTQTMLTLIEHWDGHSWQRLPSLNEANASWSELAAVTAFSPTDVWAVGDTTLFGNERPLIEHWDGRGWQLVQSPFPSQMAVSRLSGVVALSASDAWAVGASQTAVESSDSAPLVEHWDGQRWSLVASAPLPGSRPGGALAALGAVSPGNLWAVGGRQNQGIEIPVLEHGDGQQWTLAPGVPLADVRGTWAAVAVRAATDLWVMSGNSDTRVLLAHWDGTTWHLVETVLVPSDQGPHGTALVAFSGISVLSAEESWIVGTTTTHERTVIEHWDGTTWQLVPSPNPGEPQAAQFRS